MLYNNVSIIVLIFFKNIKSNSIRIFKYARVVETCEVESSDLHAERRLRGALGLVGAPGDRREGVAGYRVHPASAPHESDYGDCPIRVLERTAVRVGGRRALVGDDDRAAFVEELEADRVAADYTR